MHARTTASKTWRKMSLSSAAELLFYLESAGSALKKSAPRPREGRPQKLGELCRIVQAVCFRRRRANARRPPQAAIRPGSPAPAMGPGTVMKVSGPVPKENVARGTVVAAVTPESASVKVAGPTTKGLNCPPVIEALAFGKLEPAGRIS
jgi:hypothetical protein